MKKIYVIEENCGNHTRIYHKSSYDKIALAYEYISDYSGLMYRDKSGDGNEIRYYSDDSLAATIKKLVIID